jgi:hypothetical protein
MSITVWVRLEAVEKRVAALEAAIKPPPTPAQVLARSNASRKASGERLREDIRQVVRGHTGPKPITASGVRVALSSSNARDGKLPALRTVQWHLTAIRNARSCADYTSSK